MTCELGFVDEALAEWRKLDGSIREQFKNKLAERLDALRVPAARLSGHPDRYKIKLRSVGYRLFHEVRDEELIVVVVAVGKRERSAAQSIEQRHDAERERTRHRCGSNETYATSDNSLLAHLSSLVPDALTQ